MSGRARRTQRIIEPILKKHFCPVFFYRRRSKVERCVSVIKHRFRNYILTRNNRLRLLESLVMGIVYNIHRSIQLGILFWLFLFKRVSIEPMKCKNLILIKHGVAEGRLLRDSSSAVGNLIISLLSFFLFVNPVKSVQCQRIRIITISFPLGRDFTVVPFTLPCSLAPLEAFIIV